jgi:hypothetical protein
MNTWLLFLFIVVYAVVIDRNVADYLYLRLFAQPIVSLQTLFLKHYLLLRLRYDTYQIKRGMVSRKYMDMAKQLSKEMSKSE